MRDKSVTAGLAAWHRVDAQRLSLVLPAFFCQRSSASVQVDDLQQVAPDVRITVRYGVCRRLSVAGSDFTASDRTGAHWSPLFLYFCISTGETQSPVSYHTCLAGFIDDVSIFQWPLARHSLFGSLLTEGHARQTAWRKGLAVRRPVKHETANTQ